MPNGRQAVCQHGQGAPALLRVAVFISTCSFWHSFLAHLSHPFVWQRRCKFVQEPIILRPWKNPCQMAETQHSAGASARKPKASRRPGASDAERRPDPVAARISELLGQYLDTQLDSVGYEGALEEESRVNAPSGGAAIDNSKAFRLFRDSPGGAMQVTDVGSVKAAFEAETAIRRCGSENILAHTRKRVQRAPANKPETRGEPTVTAKSVPSAAERRGELPDGTHGGDSDDESSSSDEDALERSRLASVVVSFQPPGR